MKLQEFFIQELYERRNMRLFRKLQPTRTPNGSEYLDTVEIEDKGEAVRTNTSFGFQNQQPKSQKASKEMTDEEINKIQKEVKNAPTRIVRKKGQSRTTVANLTKVYKFVSQNEGKALSSKKIGEAVGLHPRMVLYYLKELENRRKISRVKKGGTFAYFTKGNSPRPVGRPKGSLNKKGTKKGRRKYTSTEEQRNQVLNFIANNEGRKLHVFDICEGVGEEGRYNGWVHYTLLNLIEEGIVNRIPLGTNKKHGFSYEVIASRASVEPQFQGSPMQAVAARHSAVEKKAWEYVQEKHLVDFVKWVVED